jgi:POT family proton-dependent oligopeptide transporter
MVLGLLQFYFTKHWLGEPAEKRNPRPLSLTTVFGICAIAIGIIGAIGLVWSGAVRINAPVLAEWLGRSIAAAAALYFIVVFAFYKLDASEKRRVGLIVILFLAAALFWAGFEQVGSSFNLFAERYTDRNFFGRVAPAGWFQTLGPIFIITFSPVMASLWIWLARRNANPSIPVKFGLGLVLLASGFVVMAVAAKIVAGGQKAGPSWLVITYFLHTIGELCLSPVGLSSVTKLSPPRLVGQMMGVWFLGASLGNVIAGLIAGKFDAKALDAMPHQFLFIAIVPVISGCALILLSRIIRRRLADI